MQNRRSDTGKGSRSVDSPIREALLEQGRREFAASGAEERLNMVQKWMEMKALDKHKKLF